MSYFCVPSKRVLEEARELRVAVRDMRRPRNERGDDVAKRGQGEINLRRLLQPQPGRTRFRLPLRTRQIDEIELPDTNVLRAIWVL